MTDAKPVITAVSCTAFVTPGSFVGSKLVNGASNGTVSQTSPSVYLPAFVYAQEGAGLLQVAINATTNMFFDKGDSAQVDAEVSNGGSLLTFQQMSCTNAAVRNAGKRTTFSAVCSSLPAALVSA